MKIFGTSVVTMIFVVLWSCGSSDKDELVTIHTEYGDIKAILYDETPLHKKNFLELAEKGAYDSSIFHRVIQNFMVQGGDISSKEGYETYDEGTGKIPAEINPDFFHHKGALAAARQGDNINPERKSSASQFYIVQGTTYTKEQLTTNEEKINQSLGKLFESGKYDSLKTELIALYQSQNFEAYREKVLGLKPILEKELGENYDKEISPEKLEAYSTVGGSPHLDGGYTVFGRVLEGLEVVDKIAAVQTGQASKPMKDIFMTVEVEKVSKFKIEKQYDYEYPSTGE
ncbi:MAG: peptidylprolyl isomerase [Bacteroidota bacterium]